jgi:hypothetical protein
VVGGYVAVPASVTAQPGSGCVTFEGSDGTRTVTSADLRYRVSANSGTEDGTKPEPGTPAWQQLVDAVHTDATAAEQAKTDAQTAAQQSEASAKKSGQALSDTISAKEDALKAIGDKQTTATQAVDAAGDKALKQVEASTEAAWTAASEAATSAGNADQSAQEAAGSLQELKDGIANGNFKGEPGNDGKSPVVTVTDIENGHRVSITDKDGTKTIDVLNGQAGKDGTQIDDATVGLDAWSSKHIIDTLCPPLEETGNPVVFYPVAGYPLGCKVSWEPTQEGSGEPSPENVRPIKGRDSVTVERCGENLLKFPVEKETYGISVTTESDGRYHLKGTLNQDGFSCFIGIAHLPAGTYTVNRASISTPLSDNAIVITLRKITPNTAWIETSTGAAQNTGSLAKPTDISIAFYGSTASIKEGTAIDTYFELILVSSITAPTTYTPYIGSTNTLTLPRTIYGGTVDAVTGEGLGMWKLLTLDGTEPWNAVGSGDTLYFQCTSISIGTRVLSRDDYCTTFPIASVSGSNTVQGVNGWKTSLYLRWSTFADVAALKSYLAAQYAAGTPVQIAYRRAEPVPFTATGAQPIPSFPGVNTLLTNADSVTVTGRADPIKRITDLEDAVASMTTN